MTTEPTITILFKCPDMTDHSTKTLKIDCGITVGHFLELVGEKTGRDHRELKATHGGHVLSRDRQLTSDYHLHTITVDLCWSSYIRIHTFEVRIEYEKRFFRVYNWLDNTPLFVLAAHLCAFPCHRHCEDESPTGIYALREKLRENDPNITADKIEFGMWSKTDSGDWRYKVLDKDLSLQRTGLGREVNVSVSVK